MDDSSGAVVGNVSVYTTDHGGHSAEFYAERLCARLINVSKTAPEPIKAQALYYKDAMHLLILETLKSAMASERSTVMAEIQRNSWQVVKR